MMKKLSILLWVSLLMISQITVYAVPNASKDESIYGLLSEAGSVEQLYVINAFRGINLDFGDYDTVENLSSLEVLRNVDGEIQLPNYQDMFYYQGQLTSLELPWDIEIIYELNGEIIQAKDLAGKSGALGLKILVRQGENSQTHFFENYALQISLALANEKAWDIQTSSATVVEAGGKKQIAMTVLPGQEADFEIQATVSDFEMESIAINGVKMVLDMGVDTSTMTDGLNDQLNELSEAVGELDEGAQAILTGLGELSDGLDKFTKGVNTYRQGMAEFANQGASLSTGLSGVHQGLLTISEQNPALKMGLSGIELGMFNQINEKLKQMGLELPTITSENYQAVLGGQEAFAPILIEIEQTLQLTRGLSQYLDGVSQLAEGTGQLSSGLKAYVDGGLVLASSAKEIYNGASSLNAGLKELRTGMESYKAGTAEFKEGTATMGEGMDAQISSLLDEFMGQSDPVQSFVSEKNTTITSVQFFLKTPSILKEEVIETIVTEKPKESFWERLIQLFTGWFN